MSVIITKFKLFLSLRSRKQFIFVLKEASFKKMKNIRHKPVTQNCIIKIKICNVCCFTLEPQILEY